MVFPSLGIVIIRLLIRVIINEEIDMTRDQTKISWIIGSIHLVKYLHVLFFTDCSTRTRHHKQINQNRTRRIPKVSNNMLCHDTLKLLRVMRKSWRRSSQQPCMYIEYSWLELRNSIGIWNTSLKYTENWQICPVDLDASLGRRLSCTWRCQEIWYEWPPCWFSQLYPLLTMLFFH